MATETENPGVVVQTWLPRPLARELKEHAEAERRSLSSTIRLAIEDRLRTDEERRA